MPTSRHRGWEARPKTKHQERSKRYSPPQHNTHNELIFPSLPVHPVRGDIDIHTSQRAPCQFPSLIQIRSERSANPLGSAGCEDDSPSCLKRKLQEQYTGGSSLIPRHVSARTRDVLAQSPHQNEITASSLFCVARHRLMEWLGEAPRLDVLRGKHTDVCLQCTFWGDPITIFRPL